MYLEDGCYHLRLVPEFTPRRPRVSRSDSGTGGRTRFPGVIVIGHQLRSKLAHLALHTIMAPKRRAAAPAKPAPKPKLSRLAKENSITNAQESEIREAFELFAVRGIEGFEGEKSGMLRVEDVRRCLIALGITIKSKDLPEIIETLDPSDDKFVTYEHLLAYAALYLHHNDDEEDDEEVKAEVDEAYRLFKDNHSGPITLRDLKRVTKILKEDVSDDVLKDMLREANGEAGDGWRKGVNMEDFEAVMRRAGVFG